MSDRRRFPAIRRLLSAFERRLLGLLLVYGGGRLLLRGTLLLVALYALDRLFEPPVWFRLVLLTLAIWALGRVFVEAVWRPLRQRPAARDLAALLERRHPDLHDALATAVEVDRLHPGESAELKERVAADVEGRLQDIDLRSAAPGGAARRSAFRGLVAVGVLAGAMWLEPVETRIFFDRLLGGMEPWPQATTLVMLSPYAAGEELELDEITRDLYRLQAAQGTTLTLRIRADGVVPDQVFAEGPRGRRVMQAVGGGEFVLRLPALESSATWEFRGGDDEDGTPRLQLDPGFAPAVTDWLVRTDPPAYTGLTPEESTSVEYRVPQGTRLEVRFAVDLPAETVWLRALDGSREVLSPESEGRYRFVVAAETSGERVVEVLGEDGFRNAQAGVLRWQAEPDDKPRVRFLYPDQRWATVPGGRIPLVLSAEDDYGLTEVFAATDEEGGEQWPIPFPQNARSVSHRELRTAPEGSAEDFGADFRLRFRAVARDAAQPLPQQGEARTSWIEVVSPDSFEQGLGERMVRIRERVEDLVDRLRPILDGTAGSQLVPVTRRIGREVEGLTAELEHALAERVFAGLDRGAGALQPTLAELLASGSPSPGELVAALRAPGVPPTLDRSRLLLELARGLDLAGAGPALALREAALAGDDPVAAAQRLDTALRAILEDLLAWEDFQSAVDLLRGLLDRQRNLYLRTQEASGR